jgi:hypothetical protein
MEHQDYLDALEEQFDLFIQHPLMLALQSQISIDGIRLIDLNGGHAAKAILEENKNAENGLEG